MNKLTIVEVIANQEYLVNLDDRPMYSVRRDPEYWQAYDMAGMKTGRRDLYRNDVFEQLQFMQERNFHEAVKLGA